jgi:hypothetical protein
MHAEKVSMCELPNPAQGDGKAIFNLRPVPSLARHLVPGLESLPGSATRPQRQS